MVVKHFARKFWKCHKLLSFQRYHCSAGYKQTNQLLRLFSLSKSNFHSKHNHYYACAILGIHHFSQQSHITNGTRSRYGHWFVCKQNSDQHNSKRLMTVFQAPDPLHRIYRSEHQPKEGNKWMERLLIGLCLLLTAVPLVFVIKYFDGRTPITHRTRFLIIPLWMDGIIGTYTLQALIGTEAEEEAEEKEGNKEEHIDATDRDETVVDTNANNDIRVVVDNSTNTNRNTNTNASNALLMSKETDARVKHISNIFEHILQCNNLLSECEPALELSATDVRHDLHKFQVFEWQISIVDKISEVNAMCVPGGKMVMYTGILKEAVETDDECAAIICHEIAHALCRHGVEKAQFSLFLMACGYAALSMLGIDLSYMIEKLILLSMNILLKLPMSRRSELEADEIAIHLLFHSGYELEALITMLNKLSNVQNIAGKIPEFLSTHPLTDNRIQVLKDKIEEFRRAVDVGAAEDVGTNTE